MSSSYCEYNYEETCNNKCKNGCLLIFHLVDQREKEIVLRVKVHKVI